MKKLFGIFNIGRHLNVGVGRTTVRQSQSSAGGITVRGDMCGGNMNVSRVEDLADGSYIGGDLKIGTPNSPDGDRVMQNLAKLELQVGGRIIVNGVDRTAEYKALRSK